MWHRMLAGGIKQQHTLNFTTEKVGRYFFLRQQPTVNLAVPGEASPLGSERITNGVIRGGMREELKRGSPVRRESMQKDSARGQLIVPQMWFRRNLPRPNN